LLGFQIERIDRNECTVHHLSFFRSNSTPIMRQPQGQQQSHGSSISVSSNTSSSQRSRLRILGVCAQNDDSLDKDYRCGIVQDTPTTKKPDNKNTKQDGRGQQQQKQQNRRVIAVPRSSSYGKMIQRYQERQEKLRRKKQQEQQPRQGKATTSADSTTFSGEHTTPSILSIRRSWGKRVEGDVPSSNISVGSGISSSISRSRLSLGNILAIGVPPRDITKKKKKRKKKKKKAIDKLTKTVTNMPSTNSTSSSFLARQKQRRIKKKKRALAKAAKVLQRQHKLLIVSSAPSTCSHGGAAHALDINSAPESNSSSQSRQSKIPILTLVDAFSNQKVPFMNVSHPNEKDVETKVGVDGAEFAIESAKPYTIPGRPPLHPKLKSKFPMSKSTNNAFTAVMKNPLLPSRRKSSEKSLKHGEAAVPSGLSSASSHPSSSPDSNVGVSAEPESTTLINAQAKAKKKASQVLSTTTSSFGSFDISFVANRSDSMNGARSSKDTDHKYDQNEDIWANIWNAFFDPSQQQQPATHDKSSNEDAHFLSSLDSGGGFVLSDISSSGSDEWTDDDDDSFDDDEDDIGDLDGVDDDESTLSDDCDYYDDEEYFLVMVNDNDETGPKRQGCSGVENSGVDDSEEVYLGGQDDVMRSMKRMYLGELKDIEKSMFGWFDSVFAMSPTVKESDEPDDERETDNRKDIRQMIDLTEERDSEELDFGNHTTLAEF
jgi:hypothetical protein